MSVYRTIGPLVINICPVYMKVYARFGEILSKTLKDLKKTKCYGRMEG